MDKEMSRDSPGVATATITVEDEVMTVDQVAELLRVSPRTVERLVAGTLIPYITLRRQGTRGPVRFLRSEILKWLRNRTVRPVRWKGQGDLS